MEPDRRSDRRCNIDSDEIQVSVLSSLSSGKTHSVKDISKGGLAIEYSPAEDKLSQSELVDIIAVDFDRFYLTKIACKTVYDIATLMHGRSFTGGEMRIRGLKFVELTKEQDEKLDNLLKRCFERSDK